MHTDTGCSDIISKEVLSQPMWTCWVAVTLVPIVLRHTRQLNEIAQVQG